MAFLSQALRRATAWSSRCGREFAGRAVSSASQSRLSGCVAPAGAGVAALSLPLVLCGGAAAWCLSIEEWSVRDLEDPSVEARFAAGGWTRADAGLIKGGVAKNSAIYDAMGARTEGLRAYKVFAKADGSQVTAVATFGDCCVGHPGVVHGGVTSLIFDNTLGFANAFAVLAEQGALDASLDPREASKIRAKSKKIFGFTASLTVNFRKPVLVGTTVLVDCTLDRVEGRKRFLHGTMTCAKTGAHLADATCLFVVPRDA